MASPIPVQMILDVDTGTDDALALLLAARCPLVELLAVTCVNGNVAVDKVVSNTLKVLDAADAPCNISVAKGFSEPLIAPQHDSSQVHGEDGLGCLKPPLPQSLRKSDEDHAVQVLLRTLSLASAQVTVVALGPLTNIAVAIRTDRALWHCKCAQLVWMGGAVTAGGNREAWSEFNAAGDPEAAHIVLTSGLPLLIYPWDVFLKPVFSKQELDGLGLFDAGTAATERHGPPWSVLAGRLLSFLMRTFKRDSATIGDAGAVVAALLPRALTIREMHVDMELQGMKTRGMTVCDLRPAFGPEAAAETKNARVVIDIDATAIKDFFKAHVLTQTRKRKECDNCHPKL